ncbi:hypothetical protein ZHAS_00013998 [Anopheles sinensis]|uniref:Uncharacterized protein n=1 Tax=Anopheles sinensis TaxID=74873 RepID=A0A084W733_ANOSI|nr:hypothetical protein ZHAS_00013998 [Anopheles sinensis]
MILPGLALYRSWFFHPAKPFEMKRMNRCVPPVLYWGSFALRSAPGVGDV